MDVLYELYETHFRINKRTHAVAVMQRAIDYFNIVQLNFRLILNHCPPHGFHDFVHFKELIDRNLEGNLEKI